MSRIGRGLVTVVGVIVVVIILAVVYVGFFFDVNRYKPQLERAVARSTGMTLKINGPASLRIFPRARVSLRDVHLSNHGSEFFAADSLEVTPQLTPFLRHRELIVDRVALDRPRVRIEKDAHGRLNVQPSPAATQAATRPRPDAQPPGPSEVHAVRVRNAELSYADHASGTRAEARGVDADLSSITWRPEAIVGSLSFHGLVRARTLQTGAHGNGVSASNLRSGIQYDHGLVRLAPTELNIFGGLVRGSVRADLRGTVPKFQLVQNASHVELGQIAKKLRDRVAGPVDGAANLTASGSGADALMRSATGSVNVHGQNLVVKGADIDEVASKLNSPKSLDIAQLGTGLITGQAAGTLGVSSGKQSTLRRLVSDWSLSNGIAQAKDVAIATDHNTIAFRGQINLRTQRYDDFYVASVDPSGCSKEKVQIVGTLTHPKPNVAEAGSELAKSYLEKNLEKEAGSQLGGILGGIAGGIKPPAHGPAEKPKGPAPAASCDHFYTGTVLAAR